MAGAMPRGRAGKERLAEVPRKGLGRLRLKLQMNHEDSRRADFNCSPSAENGWGYMELPHLSHCHGSILQEVVQAYKLRPAPPTASGTMGDYPQPAAVDNSAAKQILSLFSCMDRAGTDMRGLNTISRIGVPFQHVYFPVCLLNQVQAMLTTV